ncbi:replication protein A 70 kDa DNA-binding subunit C [Artemisia annua]|uniref:Replication protein A 70 kDa DNA-binding subunit C n=1 Tax=Artemisia annua TaxID=35608 RepID=A0A2U1LPR7_ARTAN|nr:replication protein A 70 kDa DNA-binding subunit C [Artemisia annua]
MAQFVNGYINDLSAVKDNVKLRVRVLRNWMQPVGKSHIINMELIVMDEQSTFNSMTNLGVEEVGQFDVIGQVIACDDLDCFDKNGKPGKKKPLTLLDAEGTEIRCTLWGAFAQQFYDFLQTCDDHSNIIAVLHLAMMKMWDDVAISTHLLKMVNWGLILFLICQSGKLGNKNLQCRPWRLLSLFLEIDAFLSSGSNWSVVHVFRKSLSVATQKAAVAVLLEQEKAEGATRQLNDDENESIEDHISVFVSVDGRTFLSRRP